MTQQETLIYKIAEVSREVRNLKKENKRLSELLGPTRENHQILISWLKVNYFTIWTEFTNWQESQRKIKASKPR